MANKNNLYLCDVAGELNNLTTEQLQELAKGYNYAQYAGKPEQQATNNELIAYLAYYASQQSK